MFVSSVLIDAFEIFENNQCVMPSQLGCKRLLVCLPVVPVCIIWSPNEPFFNCTFCFQTGERRPIGKESKKEVGDVDGLSATDL